MLVGGVLTPHLAVAGWCVVASGTRLVISDSSRGAKWKSKHGVEGNEVSGFAGWRWCERAEQPGKVGRGSGVESGGGVGRRVLNKNNPLQLDRTASITEPAVASPERAAAVIFFLFTPPSARFLPLHSPVRASPLKWRVFVKRLGRAALTQARSSASPHRLCAAIQNI